MMYAAGNIAKCTNNRDDLAAQLMTDADAWVAALGDNAFDHGTAADYTNCYDPTWGGARKAKTFAAMGNHEYDTGSAIDAFTYFGDRAGPAGLGYFSQDVGEWHVIVLNTNGTFVSYAAGSPQDQWLAGDLAANTKKCTMAIWHDPMFLSSADTPGFTVRSTQKVIWDRLYAADVDVVLNGGQHHYERMAPMNPDGGRDDAKGIREFNVGTGGESVVAPTASTHPNSEVRSTAFGILQLTLRADGYDWKFLPIQGQTLDESGTGVCH